MKYFYVYPLLFFTPPQSKFELFLKKGGMLLPWRAWIKSPNRQILVFFSENIDRTVIIWLVLESGRSELSLECFPIEFEPFLMILWFFEKNRYLTYFGGMAKFAYTMLHKEVFRFWVSFLDFLRYFTIGVLYDHNFDTVAKSYSWSTF